MKAKKVTPLSETRPSAFRLGLDLDGVFADFNTEAALTTARVTGRDLIPLPVGVPPAYTRAPYLPPVWDWWRAAGYKKTEIDAFWKHITTQPTWWADLPAYPGTGALFAKLQQAIDAHRLDVFFLTTRPGYNAHWQCVQWVKEHGIEHPQVAIAEHAESKGLLAAGLRLDAYVDDYAPNLVTIRSHSPRTRLGFYVQPWGVEYRDDMMTLGADTVEGLVGLQRFVEDKASITL